MRENGPIDLTDIARCSINLIKSALGETILRHFPGNARIIIYKVGAYSWGQNFNSKRFKELRNSINIQDTNDATVSYFVSLIVDSTSSKKVKYNALNLLVTFVFN